MRKIIIYSVLLTFFLGIGIKISNGEALATNDKGFIVSVGDFVPDFDMTLLNGDIIKISELRGKVVMLQFTASWCGVCRKEMPFIEKEIWQKHKDREDFFLAGVDRGEPLDVVQNFAKSVGISYPMILDSKAEIFTRFAHKKAGITRNIIIDKNGKIIFMTRLFDREEFDKMKEVIIKELDKK